jgi:hypothetical protein
MQWMMVEANTDSSAEVWTIHYLGFISIQRSCLSPIIDMRLQRLSSLL